MKKIIVESFKVIVYMIFMLGMLIKESAKGLFSASILGKIGIMIPYTAIIIAYVLKRPVFWIIVGIFLTALFIAALYVKKEGDGFESEWGNGTRNGTGDKKPIPFFEGLCKEEAKAEYHKLMKQYHPDNGKFGDLAKTQEIATAYSQYMARYGR